MAGARTPGGRRNQTRGGGVGGGRAARAAAGAGDATAAARRHPRGRAGGQSRPPPPRLGGKGRVPRRARVCRWGGGSSPTLVGGTPRRPGQPSSRRPRQSTATGRLRGGESRECGRGRRRQRQRRGVCLPCPLLGVGATTAPTPPPRKGGGVGWPRTAVSARHPPVPPQGAPPPRPPTPRRQSPGGVCGAGGRGQPVAGLGWGHPANTIGCPHRRGTPVGGGRGPSPPGRVCCQRRNCQQQIGAVRVGGGGGRQARPFWRRDPATHPVAAGGHARSPRGLALLSFFFFSLFFFVPPGALPSSAPPCLGARLTMAYGLMSARVMATKNSGDSDGDR